MESIWEELLIDEKLIEFLKWHIEELENTDIRVKSGQEKSFDWNDAKKELREQFI